MTGLTSTFTELDSGICGSMKFGDGSVVDIEGRGTILFMGNGGEHHRLSGVYLIPQLKANIVSLGQLDEGGSCGHGVAATAIRSNQRKRKVEKTRAKNYVLIKVFDFDCLLHHSVMTYHYYEHTL
jgi:hypothetical protein